MGRPMKTKTVKMYDIKKCPENSVKFIYQAHFNLICNLFQDEIEDEEQDEEMDDENDYGNNYFDDGGNYLDEDDNLDDGPTY